MYKSISHSIYVVAKIFNSRGIKQLILLSFSIFIFTVNIHPQTDSEEPVQEKSFKGYGSPLLTFTKLKGQNAFIIGYNGGWIIDNKYVIGLGGYSLFNRVEADKLASFPHGETYYLKISYGGLSLEYLINPDSFYNINLRLLAGGGEVKYVNYDNYDFNYHGKSGFFVLEPEVDFEVNVMKYIRLITGVSYRFISKADLEGISNKDLSGFSVHFAIKLGSF